MTLRTAENTRFELQISCAVVALTCVILAAWTWHAAGDPLIDSARDLYTAQRMANGAALYHDLNYLYGPLAPGVIAGLFKIFGDNANFVRGFDLLLALSVSLVLLDLFRRISTYASTPTVVAMLFLLFSGFSEFTGLRNYSFLLPYSHSATIGFTLALLTAWSLIRSLTASSFCWISLAAACAGLSLLTKPEMALAAMLTFSVGYAVSLYTRKPHWRRAVGEIVLTFSLVIACPFVVGRMICWNTSAAEAWSGSIAGYQMAMDPRIRTMRFFADGLGSRDASRNAIKAMTWACLYAQILLPALLLSLLPVRKGLITIALITVAFGMGVAAPLLRLDDQGWIDVFRGAPVLAGLILLGCGWKWIRRGRHSSSSHFAAALIFAILAAALLLRMALSARLWQYGFVQAAAALLLIAWAGLDWIPQELRLIRRQGNIFRAAVAGLLLALTLKHVTIQRASLARLDVSLPQGFRASGITAALTAPIYDQLRAQAHPGDTLAVAPEGCWFNYVLRLSNPTPDELLNPVGLIRSGGEESVLKRYRATPPTWFIVFNRSTAEFGGRSWGIDYARGLRAFIDDHRNYRLTAQYFSGSEAAFVFHREF